MITVQPILPHEKRFCACCRKVLAIRSYSNEWFVADQEALEKFKTNRRIISVRRMSRYESGVVRKLQVRFFPQKATDWGVDGIFCTNKCAQRFAQSAHHAGYRMPGRAQVSPRVETYEDKS